MTSKSRSRRAQVAAGLLAIAAGLGVVALAAFHLGKPAGRLDPVVVMTAGFAFAFAGATLVISERRKRARAWIGALMITCVALLFDWVAFGPGERRITNGISSASTGVRTHFWEVPGRILLVSGAVLFNLMALWAWLRALWKGKTARA